MNTTPLKEHKIPDYTSDELRRVLEDFNKAIRAWNEAVEKANATPAPRGIVSLIFQAWLKWALFVAAVCGVIALVVR